MVNCVANENGYYGYKVKDKVTGFTGIVTGYVDYYRKRTNQMLVESIDKTGRPVEHWVDVNRIVVLERGV